MHKAARDLFVSAQTLQFTNGFIDFLAFIRIKLLNKGHSGGPGEGSWQEQVTPHKLSHPNMWAYLTQGLTLLGNLCGLSAVIKEVAAAITQVS